MIVSGLSVRSETPPSSADTTGPPSAYIPEMLIVAMEHVMVLFDRSIYTPSFALLLD